MPRTSGSSSSGFVGIPASSLDELPPGDEGDVEAVDEIDIGVRVAVGQRGNGTETVPSPFGGAGVYCRGQARFVASACLRYVSEMMTTHPPLSRAYTHLPSISG